MKPEIDILSSMSIEPLTNVLSLVMITRFFHSWGRGVQEAVSCWV